MNVNVNFSLKAETFHRVQNWNNLFLNNSCCPFFCHNFLTLAPVIYISVGYWCHYRQEANFNEIIFHCFSDSLMLFLARIVGAYLICLYDMLKCRVTRPLRKHVMIWRSFPTVCSFSNCHAELSNVGTRKVKIKEQKHFFNSKSIFKIPPFFFSFVAFQTFQLTLTKNR